MNATVIVQMSAQDADALASVSMAFGPEWAALAGRFEVVTEPTDDDVNLYRDWTAYWMNDAVSMILFRSYVATFGHDYAVLYDTAGALSGHDSGGYVVLTAWTNR